MMTNQQIKDAIIGLQDWVLRDQARILSSYNYTRRYNEKHPGEYPEMGLQQYVAYIAEYGLQMLEEGEDPEEGGE